jgi:hypothetical protein
LVKKLDLEARAKKQLAIGVKQKKKKTRWRPNEIKKMDR